jgi:CheY-like chemotaxis protein
MARVLVVDDEAAIRDALRRTLESAGHVVTEAEDGRAALESFRRFPCDLMVTDLLMPEVEGVQTIVEAMKLRPDAKIVAISGGGRNGPDDYLHLAKKLGAVCTLAKPFSQQELLDVVESALKS